MATFCTLFDSYLFTFIRPTPLISATYIGLHYVVFASLVVFLLFSRANDCRACLDKEDDLSGGAMEVDNVKKTNLIDCFPNQTDSKSVKSGKNIPWFDIVLKMSRNAYYVHDPVIMWITARVKRPVNVASLEHVS